MFATDLAIATPLLILAGAALFLLVAGAYMARPERLVGYGAMAALAASAVAAVTGPQARPSPAPSRLTPPRSSPRW